MQVPSSSVQLSRDSTLKRMKKAEDQDCKQEKVWFSWDRASKPTTRDNIDTPLPPPPHCPSLLEKLPLPLLVIYRHLDMKMTRYDPLLRTWFQTLDPLITIIFILLIIVIMVHAMTLHKRADTLIRMTRQPFVLPFAQQRCRWRNGIRTVMPHLTST